MSGRSDGSTRRECRHLDLIIEKKDCNCILMLTLTDRFRSSALGGTSYDSAGGSADAWTVEASVVIASSNGPQCEQQQQDLWSSRSPYASQYTLPARSEELR